jgi:hypothetical protein
MDSELETTIRSMTDEESKRWLCSKQNKTFLQNWWEEHYPGIVPFNTGEILYTIKYDVTPLCENGNHKNFKQFPKGFFVSCKKNKSDECTCFHEMRSKIAITSQIGKDHTESRRKQVETMMARYGVPNAFCMSNHAEKTKKTLQEKYNVEEIHQIPGIKEKMRENSRKKWGTDHPRQNAEIIQQTKETNLERYGHSCSLHSKDASEKTKQTMLQRFGVENYFQNKENQHAINEQRLQTLGYKNAKQSHLSKETLTILQNKELFTEVAKGKSYERVADLLKTSANTVATYATKYQICDQMKLGYGSAKQDELYDWLTSLEEMVITNSRKIIHPLELDIYLPNRHLAIEFNGIFHHTEKSGKKIPSYHRIKYEKTLEKGIKLIQVCSTDYRHNKPIVENIILKNLGKLVELDFNIIVQKIDIKTANFFLSETHLTPSLLTDEHICFGFIHENKLIQLMVFNETYPTEYAITHFATKLGISYSLGKEMLLNTFKEEFSPTKITHHSNLSYFTGKSFTNLGFTKIFETAPNFQYTNYKKKFDQLPDGSDETKYDKIWDCGQAVWEWTK